MWKFLRLRLLSAVPVIVGVVTLTFLLVHIVPGDPVDRLLGEYASAQDRETMRETLGLNAPLLSQYGHFWKGVVTFDWGVSISREEKVFTLIASRFPNTLVLALASLVVSVFLAVPAAVIATKKRRGLLNFVIRFFSLSTMSLPIFVAGPLAVLLFSIKLRILPVAGFDSWSALVLPALCMGTLSSGLLFKMLRNSLIDCVDEDYVRTARAKGLTENRVFYSHILRNAGIPVLTLLGNMLGGLLAGAVVTETIFDWPGIGRLFYAAFQARDFPLIQGLVLWIALSYILVNILVDLLLSTLDPRVKLEGSVT